MKIKIILALSILVASIGSQKVLASSNQHVRISFPATSYCSGYAGKSNNFIIELSEGQDLTVGVKNNKPIRVLGPAGNVIPFKQKSSHLAEWRITESADHKIQLLGDGLTLLDICAIDTPDQPVFDPALGA